MRWVAKLALLCLIVNIMLARELSATTSNTAIILFGGYDSCTLREGPEDIGLFQPLKEKLQKFRQQVAIPFRYFLGCYRLETDKVYITDDAHPEHNRPIAIDKLDAEIKDWQNAADPIDQYVLIGTSYGGWTVVKLLEDGAVDPQKTAALYTLDPISRTECTPQVILKNMFNFNGSYKSSADNPCLRAPAYWKNLSFLNKLQWTNFYQTDYSYIHSSESPLAGANKHIPFNTPVLKNFAHRSIQTDSRVWDQIFAELAPIL